MKNKILRSLSCLLFSLGLVALVGCQSGPQRAPSAFEQKFYTIQTNFVPVVEARTNTVVVTNVIEQASGAPIFVVSTNVNVTFTSNAIPQYALTPNDSAKATATTGGAITNTFAPGFGGIVTAGLGGLFGLWGTLRSRKSNQAAAAFAQIIETGEQVLLTVPNGAAIAAQWKAWMIKHQAETNTIGEASKLVANIVNTGDAKLAADEITALLNSAK